MNEKNKKKKGKIKCLSGFWEGDLALNYLHVFAYKPLLSLKKIPRSVLEIWSDESAGDIGLLNHAAVHIDIYSVHIHRSTYTSQYIYIFPHTRISNKRHLKASYRRNFAAK